MTSRDSLRLGVAQMADFFGMDAQTLRFYDRQGVFSPAGRSANGYRFYTMHQVPRLLSLLQLRGMDLPLARAREMVAETDLSANLDRWADHERILRARSARLALQARGIARLLAMAEEGTRRAGEVEEVELPAACASPVATFEPGKATQAPRFVARTGRFLLAAQEAATAALPRFGARVSRARLEAGDCDPPDELLVVWDGPEPPPGAGTLDLRTFPAGRYLSCFYRGPYSGIAARYRELLAAAAGRGLDVAGDALEINHVDDFLVADEDLFVTRILLPVS